MKIFKIFAKISKFKVLDRKDILQKFSQTAYQKLWFKSCKKIITNQGLAIGLRRKIRCSLWKDSKKKRNEIGFWTETQGLTNNFKLEIA